MAEIGTQLSLLLASMKKSQSKMKALEWSQHFPIVSMSIFPDAKGQLTPQSEIGSGPNSNSSKHLWLSLLSTRMKKIHSKMKALESIGIFPDAQGQLTPLSEVRSGHYSTHLSFYCSPGYLPK